MTGSALVNWFHLDILLSMCLVKAVIALVYKSGINMSNLISCESKMYTNLEQMDCELDINGLYLRLTVVYRPNPSKANGFTTDLFLAERVHVLDKYTVISKDFVITGDLNFHLDVPTKKTIPNSS